MAVLSVVLGLAAGAYLLPKASVWMYKYGVSGIGATIGMWALVALVWDFTMNAAPDEGFTEFDAAATLGLTVLLRSVGVFRGR